MTTARSTQDRQATQRATGWLLALAPWLFVALWSGGYTPVKIALHSCGPLLMLALRYAGVVALLLPAYLWLRPPLPQSGMAWLHIIIVGLLMQGVYFVFANLAIGLGATAAGLAIVLGLQPILVALIEPHFIGGVVARRAWMGLLLGLAGAIVVVVAKASGDQAATLPGIASACAALVFITAGTLWEKRFGRPQHPVVVSIVQCSFAGLLAMGLAWPLEPLEVSWTWPFALSMAYLIVCNSIVSMSLLFLMLQHGQATRASSLFFLVPPCSAAIAWAILGEPFPLLALAGMALAAFGVWQARTR